MREEEEEKEGEHTGFLTTHARSFLWPEPHLFFLYALIKYTGSTKFGFQPKLPYSDTLIANSMGNRNEVWNWLVEILISNITSVAPATESSGYVWSRTPIVLTHKLWNGWLFSCLWQLPRTKMLVIRQWSRSVHLHRPWMPWNLFFDSFWHVFDSFWHVFDSFWHVFDTFLTDRPTDRPTNEVRSRSFEPRA